MDGQTTLQTWLMDIYRTRGYLTPELVREAARPDESPAHGFVFNVPPGEAAEAYYLDRAHDLIRRVKVTVLPREGGEPRRLRVFHAIPGEEAAFVYEPLEVIRRSPSKLEAARVEALRRLREAQTAVEDLDVIAAATPAGEQTARAVKAVRRARQLVEAGGGKTRAS